MRCPACHSNILAESDAGCQDCGFTLAAADGALGLPPPLQAPIADAARVLSRNEMRKAATAVKVLEQRIEQLRVIVVLTDVPPVASVSVYAFWLFNRAGFFSSAEKGGDNHGVLLLIDPTQSLSAVMIGYGLEPFVKESAHEATLAAASRSLAQKEYGAGIGAWCREFERQLIPILKALPRTFGFSSEQGPEALF